MKKRSVEEGERKTVGAVSILWLIIYLIDLENQQQCGSKRSKCWVYGAYWKWAGEAAVAHPLHTARRQHTKRGYIACKRLTSLGFLLAAVLAW